MVDTTIKYKLREALRCFVYSQVTPTDYDKCRYDRIHEVCEKLSYCLFNYV